MAFKRISGSDKGFVKRSISSITVAVGDLLAYDRANNVVILATSSTSAEDVAGVAVEAATTADTTVLVQEIVDGDEYVADTTNNTTTASNYERMVLTDQATLNNTGSDSTADTAVFMQTGVVGAASNKKITGRFVRVQDRS